MLNEEKKLGKWKESIEKVEVPQNELEIAINRGFQRAKNTQPTKKRPYVKRGIWSIIVAAILFIALVTSIRVSPVFANSVASIPGMERFVDFIRDDKGLEGAMKNEYYQPLDVTDTKDGITFTLDGVIADEEEMVIFYTVLGVKKEESFHPSFPQIRDENGNELTGSGSSTSGFTFDEEKDEQTEKFNIRFDEKVKGNEFTFKTSLKVASKTIDFELPFTVDKVKMPTTHYPLNETVEIEGQKIIIEKIKISPLKVAIHIREDQANTKKVFGFEDLRLVDESGETWTSINNGITAFGGVDDQEKIYFLQSNYFEEPKELYLQFNKLMAMDKDEAFIVIDTEKEIILQQPKDQRFSNLTVNGKFIDMNLRGDKGYHHDPFWTIFDATGKKIDKDGGSFSREGDYKIVVGFGLTTNSFENSLKIHLAGYPNYIEGDVKIKIK